MGKGLTGDGDAAGENPTGDSDATSEGPAGAPQLCNSVSCLGAGPSLNPPVRLLLLVGSQKPVR